MNMYRHCIFLHIFIIYWLALDIQCVPNFNSSGEKRVTIGSRTYAQIRNKLTMMGEYDETLTVSHYEQTSTDEVKSVWRTPEICEWNNIFRLIDMPMMAREDNICYIVAVRLLTLDAFRSRSATMVKHYKPYECLKLPINNVKSKTFGLIRPTETVMYCPASTIIFGDGRQLEVDRFLIGKGDNRRNSIRVYHLNDHGKSMDLLFYMYNVLTYFPMMIDRPIYYDTRVKNLSQQYRFHGLATATRKFLDYYDGPGFLRSSSHKEIRHKSIEETTDMCRNLSVWMIAMHDVEDKKAFSIDITEEAINQLVEGNSEFFHNSKFVVKSGFIPYVRVRRPVTNIERLPYLKPYSPSTIFCPDQIITDINNKKTYKQPGFLYSPGDMETNALFIYELEFNTHSTSKTEERIDILTGIKLANYVTWTEHATRLTEMQIEQIRSEIHEDGVVEIVDGN